MDVTNAETATAWLASWGDKLRPGILGAAIDGVHAAACLAAERGDRERELDAREARGILRVAYFKLTRKVYTGAA